VPLRLNRVLTLYLGAPFLMLAAFVLCPFMPVWRHCLDSQAKQADDTRQKEQQYKHAHDILADIG
jgi:hypothetical protein